MKILIVNYYWPPSGGPAVQRWLHFVSRLPKYNIEPIVLTVDEKYANYPLIDYSLNEKVSKQAKIFKTPTSELYWIYKKYIGKGKTPSSGFANEDNPNVIQKIARFIRGNLFIPDPRIGWNKFAFKKAREIINNHNIKLIITVGPPHSTHLIGLKLKTIYNLPWITDFHDYWTDVFYLNKFYRLGFIHAIDKKLEKKVLTRCNLILTDCEFAQEILSSKIKDKNKVVVLTMGYDEKAFNIPRTNFNQSHFIITHAGTIAASYEPQILIKALVKITKEYPQIPIKFRFIGILSNEIRKEIQKAGLSEILDEPGYVQHKVLINYLYEASVLLLINPKVTDEKNIVPGKLFEYLAVEKPIINIAPMDSESALIIEKCKAGRTFERNMEDELYHYLITLLEKWKVNKHVNLELKEKVFEQYSRENETIKLVEAIKNLHFQN